MRAEQSLENIQTGQGSWFHNNQQKRGSVLDTHPLRQRRGEGHRERAGRCPSFCLPFSVSESLFRVRRQASSDATHSFLLARRQRQRPTVARRTTVYGGRESHARKNGVANRVLWRHSHRVRRPDTPTPRRGHPRQAPLRRCAATRGTSGEWGQAGERGIAAFGAIYLAPWIDITKKQYHGGCERLASSTL